MPLSKYEQILLDGWEDTYKKAQLTLWILLALKDGPKHMGDIKEFMQQRTGDIVSADDKSMYRSLRRFFDAELIDFDALKSAGGPDKKVYKLTAIGEQVLRTFIDRNITNIFLTSKNKDLFS